MTVDREPFYNPARSGDPRLAPTLEREKDMFDINAIVNAAIAAAVQQATAPLMERITGLETKLAEAALFQHTTTAQVQIDEARMVEALNSQEWFWGKIAFFVANNSSVTADDLVGIRDRLSALEDQATPSEIAEHLSDDQLRTIARHVDAQELVASVDFSEVLDYSEIAGEINLDDLADELDADGIAEKIDVEDAIRDFFRNNTVSISI